MRLIFGKLLVLTGVIGLGSGVAYITFDRMLTGSPTIVASAEESTLEGTTDLSETARKLLDAHTDENSSNPFALTEPAVEDADLLAASTTETSFLFESPESSGALLPVSYNAPSASSTEDDDRNPQLTPLTPAPSDSSTKASVAPPATTKSDRAADEAEVMFFNPGKSGPDENVVPQPVPGTTSDDPPKRTGGFTLLPSAIPTAPNNSHKPAAKTASPKTTPEPKTAAKTTAAKSNTGRATLPPASASVSVSAKTNPAVTSPGQTFAGNGTTSSAATQPQRQNTIRSASAQGNQPAAARVPAVPAGNIFFSANQSTPAANPAKDPLLASTSRSAAATVFPDPAPLQQPPEDSAEPFFPPLEEPQAEPAQVNASSTVGATASATVDTQAVSADDTPFTRIPPTTSAIVRSQEPLPSRTGTTAPSIPRNSASDTPAEFNPFAPAEPAEANSLLPNIPPPTPIPGPTLTPANTQPAAENASTPQPNSARPLASPPEIPPTNPSPLPRTSSNPVAESPAFPSPIEPAQPIEPIEPIEPAQPIEPIEPEETSTLPVPGFNPFSDNPPPPTAQEPANSASTPTPERSTAAENPESTNSPVSTPAEQPEPLFPELAQPPRESPFPSDRNPVPVPPRSTPTPSVEPPERFPGSADAVIPRTSPRVDSSASTPVPSTTANPFPADAGSTLPAAPKSQIPISETPRVPFPSDPATPESSEPRSILGPTRPTRSVEIPERSRSLLQEGSGGEQQPEPFPVERGGSPTRVRSILPEAESPTPFPIETEPSRDTMPADARPLPPFEEIPPRTGSETMVRSTPGRIRSAERLRPQLTIEKKAPESATIGIPHDYRITVSNDGDTPARDIVVEDELSGAADFVSSNPPAEYDRTTGLLVWNIDELQAQETREIVVRIRPTGEGMLAGTATVKFRTEVRSATLIRAPRLQLEINGPEQVRVGDDVQLQFVIRNSGSGDAAGVLLRSVLPDAIRHPEGADLEYEIELLRAGEEEVVNLTAVAAEPGRPVRISAELSAAGNAPVIARNNLTVIGSQLLVERQGPARRFVGRPARFQNVVTNQTDFEAVNILVTEDVPEGMRVLSVGSKGEYNPQTRRITWKLDRIDAGHQAVLDVELQPEITGRMESVIEVLEKAGFRSRAEENTVVDVEGLHNVTADISRQEQPVAVGERFGFTVVVDNRGTAVARNVELTIRVPVGLQVLAAGTRDIPGRLLEGNVVRYSIVQSLKPGENLPFQVTLQGREALRNAVVQAQLKYDEMTQPLIISESVTVFDDQQ